MVMTEMTISASRFKAECLALLDHVGRTGVPLVVTKHGKPVARVVAVEAPTPLVGSIEFHVSDEELMSPLESWNADGE